MARCPFTSRYPNAPAGSPSLSPPQDVTRGSHCARTGLSGSGWPAQPVGPNIGSDMADATPIPSVAPSFRPARCTHITTSARRRCLVSTRTSTAAAQTERVARAKRHGDRREKDLPTYKSLPMRDPGRCVRVEEAPVGTAIWRILRVRCVKPSLGLASGFNGRLTQKTGSGLAPLWPSSVRYQATPLRRHGKPQRQRFLVQP